MDNRTKYSRILKLLKPYIGRTFHITKLKHLIVINIGSDERTIGSTLKLMAEAGLIKETKQIWKFKILEPKKI